MALSVLKNCALALLSIFFLSAKAAAHACSVNDDTRTCMACNCFFEASTETFEAKMAVNVVVISRKNVGGYGGNSICGVIYKKWAFSWTNDNKPNSVDTNSQTYKDCTKAADQALTYFSNARNPLNYYANKGVNKVPAPNFATNGKLRVWKQIDHQVFYQDPDQPVIPAPQWMTKLANFTRSFLPSFTNSSFRSGASQ